MEWLRSAGLLLWGFLRRFYLWGVPLVLLQPIDLYARLSADVRRVVPDAPATIPELLVIGLLVLGVIAAIVDTFHADRMKRLALEMSRSAAGRDAGARAAYDTLITQVQDYREQVDHITDVRWITQGAREQWEVTIDGFVGTECTNVVMEYHEPFAAAFKLETAARAYGDASQWDAKERLRRTDEALNTLRVQNPAP